MGQMVSRAVSGTRSRERRLRVAAVGATRKRPQMRKAPQTRRAERARTWAGQSGEGSRRDVTGCGPGEASGAGVAGACRGLGDPSSADEVSGADAPGGGQWSPRTRGLRGRQWGGTGREMGRRARAVGGGTRGRRRWKPEAARPGSFPSGEEAGSGPRRGRGASKGG